MENTKISLERQAMKARRLINFTLEVYGSNKTVEMLEEEGSIAIKVLKEHNIFVVTLKGNIEENGDRNAELQGKILHTLEDNFNVCFEKEWGDCIQLQLS